jgi:mono/diheme cytochrome c family protein
MMRRVLLLPLLALWALGTSALPGAAAALEDLVVKGQAVAMERCARCHATGAQDSSPHQSAPPFRDVVLRYPAEHLAEALAEGIVSGHPDMPVYVMSPDEIDAFLAYLDSLAPPEKPRSRQNPETK